MGNPIPVGRSPFGIVIMPNGTKAYVVNILDNTVSVIDTTNGAVTGNPIPVGSQPLMIAISPDGKRAYVTNSNSNTVSVIETATDTVLGNPIPVGKGPFPIIVAPDGKHVYVGNFGDSTISVVDTASNREVGTPIIVGSVLDLAVAPDGKKLYGTTGNAAGITVVDLTQNNSVDQIPLPTQAPNLSLAMTPDGSQVWVAADGVPPTVNVFDTRSQAFTASTTGIGFAPTGIAMMPYPNFSAFNANLAVKLRSKPNTDSFTLGANFTLAKGAASLDVAQDKLALRVGDFYYAIPAGAWEQVPGTTNKWAYAVAVLGGLQVQASLTRINARVYSLSLTANVEPNSTRINLIVGKNWGQLPLP